MAAITLLFAASACTRPPGRPPVDRTRLPSLIDAVLDERRCETGIETLELAALERIGGTQPITEDGVAIAMCPISTYSEEYLTVDTLTIDDRGRDPEGRRRVTIERWRSALPGMASAQLRAVTVTSRTDHVASLADLVVALAPRRETPSLGAVSGAPESSSEISSRRSISRACRRAGLTSSSSSRSARRSSTPKRGCGSALSGQQARRATLAADAARRNRPPASK
jgi:hypothetical protein